MVKKLNIEGPPGFEYFQARVIDANETEEGLVFRLDGPKRYTNQMLDKPNNLWAYQERFGIEKLEELKGRNVMGVYENKILREVDTLN